MEAVQGPKRRVWPDSRMRKEEEASVTVAVPKELGYESWSHPAKAEGQEAEGTCELMRYKAFVACALTA